MDYPWAKPGAKVVCIDAGPVTDRGRARAYLVKGRTYTVRCVCEEICRNRFSGRVGPHLNVRLIEVERDCVVKGFSIDRFRPLISQSDDIAMFQRIADKAGHRVPESA